MLDKDQILELKEQGFIRVTNMLDNEEIAYMISIMHEFREEQYNEEALKNRTAYLSDSSETRISNAFMVTTGESPLPAINVVNKPILASLVNDYQTLMSALSSKNRFHDAMDTRCMLNMQEYFSGSKPLPAHFDGEYLDMNTEGTEDAILIKEAIIASYVAVFTLHNKNTHGAILTDIVTGERTQMVSEAGDFIIFDNKKFLHEVPELEHPRAMFGFRNFDFQPTLFSNRYTPDSQPTTNKCFTGYARPISTQESTMRQEKFISDWKANYNPSLQAKF
jgi:hypothetical protein